VGSAIAGWRRRRWLLGSGLAVLLAALAWTVSKGRGPVRPRLILLVSIDTLRADHLGCYGYDRPTSPRLDALAREGVLFEDVSSPSPWTLPAHASLLTGLYPSHHTLKSHDRFLPTALPTLAMLLAREGFVTAAVVNSHNLSPRYGLDRGFQHFRYVEETADQRGPSGAITDQALEWLRQHGQAPLFVFVHYYDVHSDYRSEPRYERLFVRPYAGRADGTTAQLAAAREGGAAFDARDAAHLVDLYDAGVRQMDEELERLWAFLRGSGRRDRALIVVTSDHGEEFLERGSVLHGRTQFQEVVRVPLLAVGPGLAAGRRVTEPVSLVDVVPTLLAGAAADAPARLDGRSLLPLLERGRDATAASAERPIFGEADHNNEQEDITRMVRQGRYKLHHNRLTKAFALFDLDADPAERAELSGARPDMERALRRALESFMTTEVAGGSRGRLSPEQVEKLRSLGYVN
jgi:arylsulfatase A-like enzyme